MIEFTQSELNTIITALEDRVTKITRFNGEKALKQGSVPTLGKRILNNTNQVLGVVKHELDLIKRRDS